MKTGGDAISAALDIEEIESLVWEEKGKKRKPKTKKRMGRKKIGGGKVTVMGRRSKPAASCCCESGRLLLEAGCSWRGSAIMICLGLVLVYSARFCTGPGLRSLRLEEPRQLYGTMAVAQRPPMVREGMQGIVVDIGRPINVGSASETLGYFI